MTTMNEERAAFEDWHCEKFKTKWDTGHPTRDMHNGVYDDKYGPEHQQNMWEAHQAGAAWQRAQGAVPAGCKVVPVELLQDLHDLASDAVENHRAAYAGYKQERQARMDKTVAEASTLLASTGQEVGK